MPHLAPTGSITKSCLEGAVGTKEVVPRRNWREEPGARGNPDQDEENIPDKRALELEL